MKKLRLLWLVNVPLPGAVQGAAPVICGWIRQLSVLLANREDMELTVLYPQEHSGGPVRRMADGICHIGFYEPASPLLEYPEALEQQFRGILKELSPDILHIWGTEYVHSLALFRAFGHPERTLISIQGLISVYAEHYMAGLSESLWKRMTLRDLVHRDHLLAQQEKYRRRGQFEVQLLRDALHVAGRTSWDRHYAEELAPGALYHHCDEILREEFYSPPVWTYEKAVSHSIFASQFYYPIKGFHMLLAAMPEVLSAYPDAGIRVSGGGIIFPKDIKGKLKQTAYLKYLEEEIRRLKLEGKVRFLGNLDADAMKREFLRANVFVLPSSIENSPNSLAEAMLLGTPAVSAEVGGCGDMLEEEAQLYPFDEPLKLAERIKGIFAMEGAAEELSQAERNRAGIRHDPSKCLKEYLEAYGKLLQ